MEFSMRNMMSDKSGLANQIMEMSKKLDKIEKSLKKEGYKVDSSSSSSSSSDDDVKKMRREIAAAAAVTTVPKPLKRNPTVKIQLPETPKRYY